MALEMRGFVGSWVGFRASFLRLVFPPVDLQPPFFLPNHPLIRPRGIIPGTYQQSFGVVCCHAVSAPSSNYAFRKQRFDFCLHLDRHQTSLPGGSNFPILQERDAGYEAGITFIGVSPVARGAHALHFLHLLVQLSLLVLHR
jgi:hypothetical protein